MFGTVPDREVHVRKRSLLILRQAEKTAASQASAKKLVEVFSKL